MHLFMALLLPLFICCLPLSEKSVGLSPQSLVISFSVSPWCHYVTIRPHFLCTMHTSVLAFAVSPLHLPLRCRGLHCLYEPLALGRHFPSFLSLLLMLPLCLLSLGSPLTCLFLHVFCVSSEYRGMSLFDSSVSPLQVAEFLQSDFTDPRWRSAAERNAFRLLTHRRPFLALAFFSLASSYRDITDVCCRYLPTTVSFSSSLCFCPSCCLCRLTCCCFFLGETTADAAAAAVDNNNACAVMLDAGFWVIHSWPSSYVGWGLLSPLLAHLR